MSYKTYRIKKELDFHGVITELKERNVPHSHKKLGDSSIPAIGFNDSYGDVTVPVDFYMEVIRILLIENIDFKEQEAIFKKQIGSKILFIGLLSYAFIITLLFVKYWSMNKKNSFDKNFKYSWNFNNTELSLIDKKSKNAATVFIDKNYDYNFERIKTYSKVEGVAVESIDENEDGYSERMISYGRNFQLSGYFFDENNDGIYEIQHFILENGDTVVMTDENKNGFLELKN